MSSLFSLGPNQLIFLPKWCHVGLALICYFFFNLGPSSSKDRASNLWLSSNRIALFHWTLDLGPLSKVGLKTFCLESVQSFEFFYKNDGPAGKPTTMKPRHPKTKMDGWMDGLEPQLIIIVSTLATW